MAKVSRKLSEYIAIWNNRENEGLTALGEAATYFESVGGQFADKAKDLKKEIKKYEQTDMFTAFGSSTATFNFGADDYTLGSYKTTKKVLNKNAVLGLRGKAGIPDDYFVETVTLNEEKLYQDAMDGTLPAALKPYVQVVSQMGLGLRKQAKK